VNLSVVAACVQAEPVVLDRDGTLEKLAGLTATAAGNGATLVVFPEAFVSVYPSSVWAKALAGWSSPEAKAAFAAVARAAIAVPGPDADRIGEVAREHGVVLATGVTEIEPDRPGTLYNTLLVHGADGRLVLKHRKLVPTNHERLLWGQGDGGGLRAVETEVGRVGGLICWENYMPLARFAVYDSGVELYLAPTADDGETWQATLIHIARESRAYVISPAHFQRASAYPSDFPLRAALDGADVIGRGGSAILGPDGGYLSGPLYDEEGILYAELDADRLLEERQRFDPVGHYHRPDVLRLKVRRERA
jgi:nitrilase